eukprot:COSAG04_NODE_3568_length_2701_cov_1.525365_1_plen_277_part_10
MICSAETGKLLGMGSVPALDVAAIQGFLDDTAAAPLEGEPRQPAELWLLAVVPPLSLLVGPLASALEPSGVIVRRKAPTEEVGTMLTDLSAMLAQQHAPQRNCHVCSAAIKRDTDSRCAGCQAIYYCGRACQVQDWKHGGHKLACARFQEDMRQREALTAAVGLPFAKLTMAPELSRAEWVGWLEDRHLHCTGWWKRECGSFTSTPFGELTTPSPDSASAVLWVEHAGLSLSDLPQRAVWAEGGAGRPALSGWAAYYAARGVDGESSLALLLHFVCT